MLTASRPLVQLEGVPIKISKRSDHSLVRMAQRNLSDEDVAYVLKHGKRWFGLGAMFHFLRRKDIPREDRSKAEITRLEGTALVINYDDEELVTVWRNRQSGLPRIKRKPKRRFWRSG